MKVLEKTKININLLGKTALEQYPFLNGQNFSFSFNANSLYTFSLSYNSILNSLSYDIFDKSLVYVLRNQALKEFPFNLLISKVFNGYAMFFKEDTFYFCELPIGSEFYNFKLDEEQYYEMLKNAIL